METKNNIKIEKCIEIEKKIFFILYSKPMHSTPMHFLYRPCMAAHLRARRNVYRNPFKMWRDNACYDFGGNELTHTSFTRLHLLTRLKLRDQIFKNVPKNIAHHAYITYNYIFLVSTLTNPSYEQARSPRTHLFFFMILHVW